MGYSNWESVIFIKINLNISMNTVLSFLCRFHFFVMNTAGAISAIQFIKNWLIFSHRRELIYQRAAKSPSIDTMGWKSVLFLSVIYGIYVDVKILKKSYILKFGATQKVMGIRNRRPLWSSTPAHCTTLRLSPLTCWLFKICHS